MLLAILVNIFIISVLSFCIQVPIFFWLYKTLVKNIHIDYIYTSFFFVLIQLIINILLIINSDIINISTLFDKIQWDVNNIYIWWNLIYGITINIVFVALLTILFNKLILKVKLWDNFFITFVLLLILIILGPLLLYLYLILLD